MAKRVRYNKASLVDTISAAKRLQSERTLYIFATCYGFTIHKQKPPFTQAYIAVTPDGQTERVSSQHFRR